MATRVLVPRRCTTASSQNMVGFVAEHGDDRRSGRPDHHARPGDPRGAAAEDRGVHRRRAKQRGRDARQPAAAGRRTSPRATSSSRRSSPTCRNDIRIAQRGDLRSGGVGDPVQGRRRGGAHRQRLDLRPRRRDLLAGHRASAVELAKRIRTGVVWINNGLNMFDGPFGGFKESGIGREGGRWGMEEYTEVQQITWRS